MKKLICAMCLLLVVLIPAAAFAENFSIRNGITFGMTFEETQKIDQIEGKYSFGENLNNDDLGIQDGRLEDGSEVYSFLDRIGARMMDVYYIFDSDDNGLNSIIYWRYCFASNYESEYEIIESNDKTLQDRYASASFGEYEAMRSSTFKQILKAYETFSHPVCNQFLVPYDDYYVEVEHLMIRDTLYYREYIEEYIIYTRVDKEKASEFITNKVEEQIEIENSKKNDF